MLRTSTSAAASSRQPTERRNPHGSYIVRSLCCESCLSEQPAPSLVRQHPMMATAEHSPDLVAREQLLDLTDQLGPAYCREFIANYVSLWQSRYDRLCSAVTLADDDAAMDVVLSIKISSEMAGAQRLADLARAAQQRLACSGTAALVSMLALIAACGRETMACLLTVLD